MDGRVLFKGKQSYLEVLVDGEISFEEIYSVIKSKLESGRSFFSGSACVKVIGGNLDEAQKEKLNLLFKDEFGIITTEFLSKEETKAKEEARNKETLKLKMRSEDEIPPLDLKNYVASARETYAVFVRETVRSGHKIESRGDIVVLGDVNSGAHLIADGSIVVMGSLRGIAHAGAAGDESATVSAFRLAPLQLRIGAVIAIAPDDDKVADMPETARILNGIITITPIARQKG